MPVLHEELFHLREPQGAHPPTHRCANAVQGSGRAAAELSEALATPLLPVWICDLGPHGARVMVGEPLETQYLNEAVAERFLRETGWMML